ncbi:hypothetical protein GCM10007898_42770 [Dyella flagellata]|uniref:Uncharacterized protein n=1 Tax=Dyella flagellata TaxID=1867833 RepID=A0ABQ5XG73_9GAMM|nr:hypothetical protein GCM10007898_42770 [Dyella flagellata]
MWPGFVGSARCSATLAKDGIGNGSTNRANEVGLINGTLGAAKVAALVRAGIAIGMVEALAVRHASPSA